MAKKADKYPYVSSVFVRRRSRGSSDGERRRAMLTAARKADRFLSIRMSRFLMKTIGFWTADSKTEQRLLNGILSYTLCATAFAIWIEGAEFYWTMKDFYAVTYTACSSMPILINLMKLIIFMSKRKEILRMLKYTQNNFWYAQYDEYGSKLMEDIDKLGLLLMCTFTFFVQVTVLTYMLTPILENIGKNETDRILPFKLYGMGDFQFNVSPNFEILFFAQVLSLVHSGLCFCCFDNLLSLLNLHTAGQFKLLQHRLNTILERVERTGTIKSLHAGRTGQTVYEEIRRCVTLHHELIWYSEKMESIFMYSTLCQLLVSGVMICVAGFQVFLAQGTFIRRMIFIAHTNGCFWQLFLITMTSHNLLDESRAVGDAAYNADWQMLSHRDNRALRNAILMIMVRSTRACSISAGGFFPVSLETFMAVLSTAASYFTLLRNFVVQS